MTPLIVSLLLAARVPAPTLSVGGTYSSPHTVTVTSHSTGDTVYCVRDAQPKRSAAQRVAIGGAGTGSWEITESQTVNCRAYALDGRQPSKIATATYTISQPAPPSAGWPLICSGGSPSTYPQYVEPTSNVIYVCDCATGAEASCASNNTTASDANTGTLKSFPKRSWDAARAAYKTLPAGGTIALCKGGAWNVSNWSYSDWANSACTVAAPCTVRDYATSWGTQAPLLTQANSNGRVFTFTDASANNIRVLNLYLLDPDHGTNPTRFVGGVFSRATWDSGLSSDNGSAIFQYGNNTGIEICNTTIDGFSQAIQAQPTVNAAVCPNGDFKIRGNRIINVCGQGILLTARDMIIDGNYFDNDGHDLCGAYQPASTITTPDGWPWGPSTHTVYISGTSCPADRLQFKNNEIHHPAMAEGKAQGSALKFKNRGMDAVIDNNFLSYDPPHPLLSGTTMGFSISNDEDVAPAEGWARLKVTRNRVYLGVGTGIGIAGAPDLLAENNLIWTQGNITNTAQNPFRMDHSSSIAQTTGVIRNNTVYVSGAFTSTNGSGVYTVVQARDPAAATGPITFTGNAAVVVGGEGSGASGTSCFVIEDPSKIVYMDNNLCAAGAGVGYVGTGNYGATENSYATWVAAHPSFDAHSTMTATTTGLFVNPVNTPTGDNFTPALGSPLVNHGSTATCTVQGVSSLCSSQVAADPVWNQVGAPTVLRDASPDIGAMER